MLSGIAKFIFFVSRKPLQLFLRSSNQETGLWLYHQNADPYKVLVPDKVSDVDTLRKLANGYLLRLNT